MGINPGVLHKIASAACITLDSLPHNGVMVTVLACFGLTHKEGYKHLFAITVVGSIIILIEANCSGKYHVSYWVIENRQEIDMKGYRDDRIRELEALYPFWQEKTIWGF